MKRMKKMRRAAALGVAMVMAALPVNAEFLEETEPTVFGAMDKLITIPTVEETTDPCIPGHQVTGQWSDTAELISAEEQYDINAAAATGTVDMNVLTKFNTVVAPTVGNGANDPKYSYTRFLNENVSPYSGELTLSFEDLALKGRNGLDLKIGRTYQTVASDIGEKTMMIFPDSKGRLRSTLVINYSSYLLDRYNLGVGWGFNFPSIQIETEYEPEPVATTYYYTEHKELYYHTGAGEVYPIEFTPDTTDSNLKGYDQKDIQLNKEDTAFSNGQECSYYSMTLADQTKQYFGEDGRLLGVVDRFGNTIRFEHTMSAICNRVPEGNFRYDDEMWSTSATNGGAPDAYPVSTNGKDDSYSMYFRRNNAAGDSYILSQPIQVQPMKSYQLGASFHTPYGGQVKVEIIGYDTGYQKMDTITKWTPELPVNEWYDFTCDFTASSAMRYVTIRICPDNAKDMYIDNVSLDEPKPLISKITDSVGRTITFSYEGRLFSKDATGSVTLMVKSPDGQAERTLVYNKEGVEFATEYREHDEQRLFWYLSNSSTEGTDGSVVRYGYEGGAAKADDGTLTYPNLYMSYSHKAFASTDPWSNKPVISSVQYKDRRRVYEYETVRKHMGDNGYYDTLRVNKSYDMYSYVPAGASKNSYMGAVNQVSYSYSGSYNGNTYDNETGYPSYTFDSETTLNEQWTQTRTGRTTDRITFSNHACIRQTTEAGGTRQTVNYTNHSEFKNLPAQIERITESGGKTEKTYLLYSYNEWGGKATETGAVTAEIRNDANLLEKHTTHYAYDPDHHFVTEKKYYHRVDRPQVWERNVYDASGRLTESENAVGEKTKYFYQNPGFPGNVTKTVQANPMGFAGLLGGDRVTAYAYDDYGLYALTVSESCEGNQTAVTSYMHDYLTGELLKETRPDQSQTSYSYYSDGRIKHVVSPYTQYLDGRLFRREETHSYQSNAACPGYDTVTRTFDVEYVNKYVVYADDESQTLRIYGAEINFYDAAGNLKMNMVYDFSQTDAEGYYKRINTEYYHDSYDRIIKVKDGEGNTAEKSYDGYDRIQTVTDSEGNVYTYTYDDAVRTSLVTLNGHSEGTERKLLMQKYDRYGNMIERVAYPNNGSDTLTETYTYDLQGNVTGYTNPNGNRTQYESDAANRVRKTILPNGVKATASYSSFDEPSFEKIYDSQGKEKLSRAHYRNEKGDLQAKFYSYDDLLTDMDTYECDAKGRPVSISEGEHPKTALYDQTDNLIVLTSGTGETHRRYNWFGETASAATDGSISEVRYGYDNLGRVAAKRQDDSDLQYAWSDTGRLTDAAMPSERLEHYTYTPNGNLKSIQTEGSSYTYEYYDNGQIKSIRCPNGLTTQYEYDNINRVTSMVTTLNGREITRLLYSYDNNGNILTESRNGQITAYTYDTSDRLASVTYPNGEKVSYEYDALNNRTRETSTSGTVKQYIYNSSNQLSEVKENGQTTDTYTYNRDGALTKHNSKTYTYDRWDRMTGYSDGSVSHSYRYDANGIRTVKDGTGYVTDIRDNVVAETGADGTITKEVLWGHRPLARKDNGVWYYYLYNAHGDVIGMADSSGALVNEYTYDAWGRVLSERETVENPIRYAGEYYDSELEMYYLRARYYDPATGRFTSVDAVEGDITNPMDMNRYVYCGNNPVNRVDPSGANWLSDIFQLYNEAEMQKARGLRDGAKPAQRAIWRLGAQNFLRERQGYLTSAWMLEHSLQDNPSDEWRGNDSHIAYLINNDRQFSSMLQQAIDWSDGNTVYGNINVAFSTGDLFYSIHRATININGYKQDNGSWLIHCTMSDVYDFTEIMTLMGADNSFAWNFGLGTIANDAAAFSQLCEAIRPYTINVDFYVTRW